jgi:hypothetical protein
MQVYRAGNPKKLPVRQCAQRQEKEISFREGSKGAGQICEKVRFCSFLT